MLIPGVSSEALSGMRPITESLPPIIGSIHTIHSITPHGDKCSKAGLKLVNIRRLLHLQETIMFCCLGCDDRWHDHNCRNLDILLSLICIPCLMRVPSLNKILHPSSSSQTQTLHRILFFKFEIFEENIIP